MCKWCSNEHEKTNTIIDNPYDPSRQLLAKLTKKIENNKLKEEIKNVEELCRDNQKIPLPKVLTDTEADKKLYIIRKKKRTKVYPRFNCEKILSAALLRGNTCQIHSKTLRAYHFIKTHRADHFIKNIFN